VLARGAPAFTARLGRELLAPLVEGKLPADGGSRASTPRQRGGTRRDEG
jgi:hypothetical protein